MTMAERPSDLLPCPFCGGTARIDWGKTFRYVGIECDSCAAFGGEITGIPSEADRAPYIKRAIKKWNTRARTLDAAPADPVVSGENHALIVDGLLRQAIAWLNNPHPVLRNMYRNAFTSLHEEALQLAKSLERVRELAKEQSRGR